jgi:hypothetical protein
LVTYGTPAVNDIIDIMLHKEDSDKESVVHTEDRIPTKSMPTYSQVQYAREMFIKCFENGDTSHVVFNGPCLPHPPPPNL